MAHNLLGEVCVRPGWRSDSGHHPGARRALSHVLLSGPRSERLTFTHCLPKKTTTSFGPCWPTPVFFVKEPDALSVGRSYVRITFTSFHHIGHTSTQACDNVGPPTLNRSPIQFTGRADPEMPARQRRFSELPGLTVTSSTTCLAGSFPLDPRCAYLALASGNRQDHAKT